jgi:hypothetical protein
LHDTFRVSTLQRATDPQEVHLSRQIFRFGLTVLCIAACDTPDATGGQAGGAQAGGAQAGGGQAGGAQAGGAQAGGGQAGGAQAGGAQAGGGQAGGGQAGGGQAGGAQAGGAQAGGGQAGGGQAGGAQAGGGQAGGGQAGGGQAGGGQAGGGQAGGGQAGGGQAGGGLSAPTPICGTSILNGPTSAPAGAVAVSPGAATLQNAISQHAAGTTYYLTAGTYSINGSIQPHNNDTFIGAPGAIIDGAGTQSVAFGLNNHNTGVTIEYLTIRNFNGVQNNGIINQGQGSGWTIQYNTISNPSIAASGGNSIELGDHNIVRYNCFSNNAQGAMASSGNTDLLIDHNEIVGSGLGYNGNCGCTSGMKLFGSNRTTITNNWLHNNHAIAVWVDTNNTFFYIGNNFFDSNDEEAIVYEISYNAVITNNYIRHNTSLKNMQNSGFPNGSIYISNSGGFDAGAPVIVSGVDTNGTISIVSNTFDNNPNGVTLYEDANRYCVAGTGCIQGQDPNPLYAEVDSTGKNRWNAQNISVKNNTFLYSAADAGCNPANTLCAVNALISTSSAIDNNVAFQWNNHYDNDIYVGPWRFLAPDQGSSLSSFATWQTTFSQDLHSTISP